MAVKIIKEEPIIDGLFDMNKSKDVNKCKKAIKNCKKFTSGSLYDFLYNPTNKDKEI